MYSSQIFLSLLALAAASPKPGVVAPAYITAHSSQYFFRNHNTLAAPILAAPLIQTIQPVASAPLIRAPAFTNVISAPLIRESVVAAPLIRTPVFSNVIPAQLIKEPVAAAPLIRAPVFSNVIPAPLINAPAVAAPIVNNPRISAPLIKTAPNLVTSPIKYSRPILTSSPINVVQANPVFNAPFASSPIFQSPLLKPAAVTAAIMRNNFVKAQNPRNQQEFAQRKAAPNSKLVSSNLERSRNDLNSRNPKPIYYGRFAQAPRNRPFVPETVSPDMVETFDPVVRNVPQQVAINQRPVFRSNGFVPGFNPFFTTQ